MKRVALLLISIFALVSCSDGGGGSASAEEQIFGEWYWEMPGSTNTRAKGLVAKIEANGKVAFAYVYAITDGVNAVVYMRNSIGNWSREGSTFTFKYIHETCDPVGQETMDLSIDNGKLRVVGNGMTITLSRPSNTSSIKTMAAIEDKNCNIVAKIEAEKKRLPANSKKKSFFERFNEL